MMLSGYNSATRIMHLSLLLLFSLMAAGCSGTGTANNEANEELDKSVEAIEAVIEKEFNAPDEEYRALSEEAMMSVMEAEDEEEYAELRETPVYQEYVNYMEDTYAPYFNENGYDAFINTGFAFSYSTIEGDFSLSPSDIKIEQSSDSSPALYSFSFIVNAEGEEGVTGEYQFEGKANVPEEGKIGTIEFRDKDGLQEKLKSAY
ncbi:hypothetical protein [Jeotgalibacillus proteolyticus]|uniref:DUF3993 domain-containing protein n=1 Tax=Jeotgalibacillus proteolyticus TaxID=2082395 RepID=A0A2S5G9S9_9BACL|nr:hypothetical protein [Jeotgalibacillus proteolyticus]PPA69673.1 hypothetical protein C4B60_14110 [Jeotgalibacillus proteolyticus]